jgi:glutathione S-transferase
MIIVHHLNNSRSQRILWLLEELGLPYELKIYQRDAQTRLAPPELKAVSPLGKSPVITDGDATIIETGAIIDYIIRHHGGGRMQPDMATRHYDSYVQWLHYGEGSAMLPLMLRLYVGRLKDAGAPLEPRISSETANHLSFIEGHLTGTQFFNLGATGAAASGNNAASTATWRADNFTVTGSITPVPVPAAVWLLGSAMAGVIGWRRRAA